MSEIFEVASNPVEEYLDTDYAVEDDYSPEAEYLNEEDALALKTIAEGLVAGRKQYEELLDRHNQEREVAVSNVLRLEGGQQFFLQTLFAKAEYNLAEHVDAVDPTTGQILRGAAVAA